MMLNRREVAVAGLAMCVVGPAAATEPKVWDRSLLQEAWIITEGKDEAGMYEALTQRFGSFPIMFRGYCVPVGREVEVGIFGVYHYPPDFNRRDRPRRGYLDCDVRVLSDHEERIGNLERDGPWRSDMSYYHPAAGLIAS
jgi:hypothetical protein